MIINGGQGETLEFLKYNEMKFTQKNDEILLKIQF